MNSTFKKQTLVFSTLLLFVFLLSSCTITRMRYNRGFNLSLELNLKSGENGPAVKSNTRISHFKQKTRDTPKLQLNNFQVSLQETKLDLVGQNSGSESVTIIKQNKKVIKKKFMAKSGKFAHHFNCDKGKSSCSGIKNKQERIPDKVHSGDSWLIALLLCLFLGTIGLHRFYLGYTTIGIIQLLTLGMFGIWTLIDLIRIVVGTLKPKDGEYSDY